MRRFFSQFLLGATVLAGVNGFATESENQGLSVLHAAKAPVIDGKIDDWNLSGGMFICGDVENLRDRLAVWYHASWDADNLYVLARWIDDTPMNNPGSVAGDHGWDGDCLQFRVIVSEGEAKVGVRDEPDTQRTTHVTAWRDRDGKDVVDLTWGQRFNQGGEKDAKTKGAMQAFAANADGKGYVQEIAMPWSLIAPKGWQPEAGKMLILTVEPNFGTATRFRISFKDLFRPGIQPDRVFTFQGNTSWGFANLLAASEVKPAALRLADNRELPVNLRDGRPAVDWGPLYVQAERPGVVPIHFNLPSDGYVSLNIKNAEGQVVRHLLTANFLTAGEHEVKWDGMTNFSFRTPGEVLPAGAYSWEMIQHQGLGLRLVGWADNGGKSPFDSPGGNWGGDMGLPATVDTDGKRMFLGWDSSEAGKAVVCTDLNGQVLWRQKRGGFGAANELCEDGGTLYVNDRQQGENVLYRLDTANGQISVWKGSTDSTLDLHTLLASYAPTDKDHVLTGLDGAAGRLYLSYAAGNVVLVLDGATGAVLKKLPVAAPGDLEVGGDGQLYVLSQGTQVVRFAADADQPTVVVDHLTAAAGLAIGKDGEIYVGVGDPDQQVVVFGADGKAIRTIGTKGGRPLLGPWQNTGLRQVHGLRVDVEGKLWAMEYDGAPKRISVWNAADGSFVKEFFGPTSYGAGGGAICPTDPLTMVGQGCEWKLDAETGRATCVAVIARGRMENSRFGQSPDGRVYLAIGGGWHGQHPVAIYERLGSGQWKLRTRLLPMGVTPADYDGEVIKENRLGGIKVWADANDDEQVQADEVKEYPFDLGGWIDGWYMPMTPDMTFYGGYFRLAPVSWTACGAPVYDPTAATPLPRPKDPANWVRGGMGAQRGIGSADGTLALYNGFYAQNSDFPCFDIATGQLKWSYPNLFVGVHGGHEAPPAEAGMIRAAYDVVGSVKLPEPIGNLFVIATDKGEWHLLNGDGFYISSLFQGDALKIQWPENPAPGAIVDNVPPGMGAEDFGGSVTATADGQLYLQAGKTAFINFRVVGLETVKRLAGGTVQLDDAAVLAATLLRADLQQEGARRQQVVVKDDTIDFTGNLRQDFGVDKPMSWSKAQGRVSAAVAHDDTMLYLAWEVSDATPWVNGAEEAPVMYARGDTVDFQLATNPDADPKRTQAVAGDLRLSIGNFHGTPTAVLYEPVSAVVAPRKFFSGTVKEGYEMQRVRVLADSEARIKVTVNPQGRQYVVEAAIPLAVLGLTPKSGTKLAGDFGATFGNPAGDDTVLRAYWNNQATDFVADEVWELKLEPRNWGVLVIE